MERPLVGVRILDLTQNMCGPFCTQLLGDLGAEVLKIEPPGGDPIRREGTRHGKTSISYISFNRGKKSVVLDLKKSEHREVFLRLLERADVLVEDLKPEETETLRLDEAALLERRADLIRLSISGYGKARHFRHLDDQDAIVQALSGFMSITGENGGAYTKAGVPIADLFTGLYGAIGVLAGILYRDKTGQSLHIETAKLSVMLTAMPDSMSKYLNTGEITRPKGSRHQLVGLFQPVEAKDGLVICMAAQEHQFKALTQVLGLEGLEEDSRFNSMYKRCENADELEPIIFAKTRQMTMKELTDKLLAQKIPAGPINTLDQLLEDEYIQFHRLITQVRDSAEGSFRVVGFPLRFETFQIPETSFASQPGEDTRPVLRDFLGMGDAEIELLRSPKEQEKQEGTAR